MATRRTTATDLERIYAIDEFEQMPEFDEHYELIEGRLVEKAMPKPDHNRIVRRIMRLYDRHDPNQAKGEMLQETSFRLSGDYSPAPDISWWQAGREPAPGSAFAPIPDLAIEVQSTGQSLTGLAAKAQDYIDGGVRLVWVIQIDRKVTGVFRPGQAEPQIIQLDGELSGENVIPGFTLALREVYGE